MYEEPYRAIDGLGSAVLPVVQIDSNFLERVSQVESFILVTPAGNPTELAVGGRFFG